MLRRALVSIVLTGAMTACVFAAPPPGADAQKSAKRDVVWVYHDGDLVWGRDLMNYGDYDYNYRDKTDPPPGMKYSISVKGTQGGFQPGSPNLDFDTTGYNYLIVSFRPTQENNSWIGGIESSDSGGDTVIPGEKNPDFGQYCDVPFAPGRWSSCKVPLHAGGFNIPVGQHVRKIMFQQQAPAKGVNTWYIGEIGFVP